MTTRYVCRSNARRQLVDAHATLNGIDYLEVVDLDAPPGSPRQQTLLVHFLKDLPATIARDNVRITGGVRITPVNVAWAFRADKVPSALLLPDEKTKIIDELAEPKQVLVARTTAAGDFSTYTLVVVASATASAPPAGIDARLASVDFSFKVECPDEYDCRRSCECPPDRLEEPEITYLAKDYATFKRQMLDRLSVTMPEWRERNPADTLVALVELLANAGDHLSYMQDAVATEAYLGTARRRVSVRRHARMLDYRMHEGTNARTWVVVDVQAGSEADGKIIARGTKLRPRAHINPSGSQAPPDEAFVFETLHDLRPHAALGRIDFHTWGEDDCCLPVGSTGATLVNDPPLALVPGDVLIFEEIVGPATGLAADADTSHRQAVRVTNVTPTRDDAVPVSDPPPGQSPFTSVELLEVEWNVADALTFPLCLSVRRVAETGPTRFATAVARGNVVLADHGDTLKRIRLARVPATGVYRPFLGHEITFGVPYDHERASREAAAAAVVQNPREAMPLGARLFSPEVWLPRIDLLDSDRFASEFVVEVERDGSTFVRFGDDINGKRPARDAVFEAQYRVGGGTAGKVGAEVIARMDAPPTGIRSIRNPLPAVGGVAPESMEEVRQYAPWAFRKQERAVTEADYAEVAERHLEVQKAAARFRWTGSWYTVYVTIDRTRGRPVLEDAQFVRAIREHIERYRLAGYDLEIRGPLFVPLEIELRICVKPGYFRSTVRERLESIFSARDLPAGARGFFHPDLFTFGQPIYLSQIYKAAAEVEGVASVEVLKFKRLDREPAGEMAEGSLQPGDIEIVQLDNDPSFPEKGALRLDMRGGL